MHTYKYFCPRCLKTAKSKKHCCGEKAIKIGVRLRLPSPKASRSIWKYNLKRLSWYVFDEDLMQLYKKYNLPYFFYSKDGKHIFRYYKGVLTKDHAACYKMEKTEALKLLEKGKR